MFNLFLLYLSIFISLFVKVSKVHQIFNHGIFKEQIMSLKSVLLCIQSKGNNLFVIAYYILHLHSVMGTFL